MGERFQRAVRRNWGNYNHEHYFAIERIVALLDRSLLVGFKARRIDSLSEVMASQRDYEARAIQKGLDPLLGHLRDLTWNVVFGQFDSSAAVRTLLGVVRQVGSSKLDESKWVAGLQLLLFVF